MKKSENQALQRTLVFAATVAALGASVGVPVERALAAPGNSASASEPVRLAFALIEQPVAKNGAKSSAANSAAIQQKADRNARGAKQGKERNAKSIGGAGGFGDGSVSPQPSGSYTGPTTAGRQNLPAVQK